MVISVEADCAFTAEGKGWMPLRESFGHLNLLKRTVESWSAGFEGVLFVISSSMCVKVQVINSFEVEDA